MAITLKSGLCAASIVFLAGAAQADDLLLIDLSTANEITISATAGASAVSHSGSNFTGIYMENFYGGAGNSLAATLLSGNLSTANEPSDNSPSLFRGGLGTDPGLNMWSFSTSSTVTFTAGQQAFSGSATWSLDAIEYADMVAGMSSGNIYFAADTADDIGNAMLIGTYRVVPTPAALSLLGLGLGAGALRRRR